VTTIDEHEFVQLTAPHRRALHLHCYRLLGSLHDADDALQETLLRSWQAIDAFEPRAPLSAWLYRIATNVCFRMLEQRARRDAASIDSRLEPYPDRLLEQVPSPDAGPAEVVEAREHVELAFVAAMQLLPPKQRAVLVLRDVLGWSAREVAQLLDDTVGAVNSALQRARERLERERAEQTLVRRHQPASREQEAALMRRWVEAWEAVDVDGMLALLRSDALMTMPPDPRRFENAESIVGFFATVPLEGRLDRIALVPVRANGQPALAAYADGAAYGVMVFAVQGDAIAGITGFASRPELFDELGLDRERGG
jgi:RNA polymerase sigma-70 factor (ECF subfamily)